MTEIHRQENSSGIPKLKKDANRGGKIAGIARKKLEKSLNDLLYQKITIYLRKNVKKLNVKNS